MVRCCLGPINGFFAGGFSGGGVSLLGERAVDLTIVRGERGRSRRRRGVLRLCRSVVATGDNLTAETSISLTVVMIVMGVSTNFQGRSGATTDQIDSNESRRFQFYNSTTRLFCFTATCVFIALLIFLVTWLPHF
jgi:hypothetical protein